MKYIVDHIPRNTLFNRRPGLAMAPTTITIHNTGNPSSSARNERAWLTNTANNRTASYHIVVDENEAIEVIPLNENAWHAGDGSGPGCGNRTSIGIEICESGDYARTLQNAAQLVASMLREREWGVDRLRRHFDWSGKICPRLMYDDGKWTGWAAFKNMVAALIAEKEEETLELSAYQWQTLRAGVAALLDKGAITDKTWLEKIDKKTLTTSELSWLTFVVATK
ncbi:peptidoglycan recognition protein family protein [Cohnella massiliensis]|uniref:peptidoglycan recognition protein family protein n=1 Tax=Cohnella massiliensis TaxID=1816691 RepID=UPI001BC8AAA5|nr:N-acetylmuramoyl-L-alanine amidase [Cohnella massiliensis]